MLGKPRVLLKISGQSFSGENKNGFDKKAVKFLAKEIASVANLCELSIVVGGGNIFRGSIQGKTLDLDIIDADYAGMVATIVNGIILRNVLKKHFDVDCRLQSSLEIREVAEAHIRLRAIRHLEKGRVVIFSCGVGEPRFTTDTGMVLRAMTIGADTVLKGTKVDGIYDQDPKKYQNAKFIPKISYRDFINTGLQILDTTAVSLAKDNDMALRVFNIFKPGNLKKIIQGKPIGSIIE